MKPDAKTCARIEKLCRFIESHADEPLTLDRLGREAGMSPAHLQKVFKAVTGLSPKAWQDAQRLGTLKSALREGRGVAEAIFDAGYGSTSRVYERLDGGLGMTPSAYRAGGEGEEIAWACRDSALGPLLMAATSRGVCCVQFGDDEASLLGRLRAEFPRARLVPAPASSSLQAWMGALDDHLAAAAPRPELPLDLRGTAFQLRVWRFLCSVREGEVVSYGELAARLGAPRAARAVAGACARNRVAVLVPCHRVLRGDGALGGYRWGEPRKRALIEIERGAAAGAPLSGRGR